jgi:hypothetical protein
VRGNRERRARAREPQVHRPVTEMSPRGGAANLYLSRSRRYDAFDSVADLMISPIEVRLTELASPAASGPAHSGTAWWTLRKDQGTENARDGSLHDAISRHRCAAGPSSEEQTAAHERNCLQEDEEQDSKHAAHMRTSSMRDMREYAKHLMFASRSTWARHDADVDVLVSARDIGLERAHRSPHQIWDDANPEISKEGSRSPSPNGTSARGRSVDGCRPVTELPGMLPSASLSLAVHQHYLQMPVPDSGFVMQDSCHASQCTTSVGGSRPGSRPSSRPSSSSSRYCEQLPTSFEEPEEKLLLCRNLASPEVCYDAEPKGHSAELDSACRSTQPPLPSGPTTRRSKSGRKTSKLDDDQPLCPPVPSFTTRLLHATRDDEAGHDDGRDDGCWA